MLLRPRAQSFDPKQAAVGLNANIDVPDNVRMFCDSLGIKLPEGFTMGGKKKRPKQPGDDVVDPKSGFSRSELWGYSVDELKGLLRIRGLPVSGTKQVLVDRLMTNSEAKISLKKPKPTPVPKTSAAEKKVLEAAGLTESQINNTDHKYLKTVCTGDAKSLAGMVDADWHDGYEEQEEKLIKSLARWNAPMTTVVTLSDSEALRSHPKAPQIFERCHETLRTLADGWNQINSVPFRSPTSETLRQLDPRMEVGDRKFKMPEEALACCWTRLLPAMAAARTAADKAYTVDDAQMFRFIKDAVDCGVDVKTEFAVGDENKNPADSAAATTDQHGLARLRTLITDSQWSRLPNNMKVHKRKRAIDRRFSGAKCMRTRCFEEDYDEWL